MDKVSVLLVDDQLLFLESLKIVLENLSEEIEVCGLASSGLEAISLAATCRPDVILMDVSMPEMDGIEASARIKAERPDVNIIMLTTFEEKGKVQEAIKLGINGYLLKNLKPELLIQYILLSAEGGVFLSTEVADRLCRQGGDEKAEDEQAERCLDEEDSSYKFLTRREKEVLKYLAMDMTNMEIAEKIHVGYQTIRNYISVIYSKLNVSNRMEVIKKIQEL